MANGYYPVIESLARGLDIRLNQRQVPTWKDGATVQYPRYGISSSQPTTIRLPLVRRHAHIHCQVVRSELPSVFLCEELLSCLSLHIGDPANKAAWSVHPSLPIRICALVLHPSTLAQEDSVAAPGELHRPWID
ncbi:hypothetical protein PVAP13_6NG157306 [Panicum virgatum]|uniref:Uncharacterized protein n=1 Tax=Panicum virgatum TaxID=38727 RepID=A0A8T0QYW1_PANVG|nr:hypothetical protein PVAP13_6NG157306 [Panicum virgatum]